jgi:hypothetical protein
LKEENKKYLHLVEYNDLINNPEKEIDEIYDFLKIEKYPHKYNYIADFDANGIKYNDDIWNCNFHQVKHKIKSQNYKVSDILPESIISRYSNMEFWR